MRKFAGNLQFHRAIILLGCALFYGFGGGSSNEMKGGYPANSQGVSHYVYVQGEYIPVPYAYSPVENNSTYHYRNPPVFGNNLDQLQGTTPGLYARPFKRHTTYFYR